MHSSKSNHLVIPVRSKYAWALGCIAIRSGIQNPERLCRSQTDAICKPVSSVKVPPSGSRVVWEKGN